MPNYHHDPVQVSQEEAFKVVAYDAIGKESIIIFNWLGTLTTQDFLSNEGTSGKFDTWSKLVPWTASM